MTAKIQNDDITLHVTTSLLLQFTFHDAALTVFFSFFFFFFFFCPKHIKPVIDSFV